MSQAPVQQEGRTPRPAVPFDDRAWPAIVVLLGLAAAGGAAIAALGNFDETRLWANAWTWVSSLAVLTFIGIWVVARSDPARHGVQLAAELSLIFHIALFLFLNGQRLTAAADARLPRPPERVDEFRAPDFHIRAPEDPIAEHEKPLATVLPEEVTPEPERLEKPRVEEPTPLGEPTPQPGQEEIEPHAVPQREIAEAAPRLSELNAELSRAEPRPLELAEPEPLAKPAQELPAEPDAPAPADSAVERDAVQRTSPNLEPAPAASRELAANVDVAAPSRPTTIAAPPAEPSAARERLPERLARAPQLEAARIGELPRAQSGVDQPLEDPQPLVKVPVRRGAGVRLPVELGAVRNRMSESVSIVDGASPLASARPAQLSAGSSEPAQMLAGSSKILEKTATAAPAPSLGPALPGTVVAAQGAAPRSPDPAGPTAQPARRRAAANLPAPTVAPPGIGGLAAELSPQVGTPSRRAREESQVVPATARLLARTSGGPPTIDGRTREPAAAFARRGPRLLNRQKQEGEPSEQTEAAIELGLMFLARCQQADGSWSFHFAPQGDDDPDSPPAFRAQTAATGLALLSFLGAGYDHYGGRYAEVVQRAIDYLVKHQKPTGDLYILEDEVSNRSAHLYSHGIAAIALSEAYGMTGDDALAAPAQKAIDFIVAAQDPARGGWRYIPGTGADTSVSGWQLMALKSGELAGLNVPRTAYQRVERWLDRSQLVGSQYAYNPLAPETPEQVHGRRATAAMTAVGLLMRLYTGLNRDDAHMIEGAEYLLGRLPRNGTLNEPARDTYYWYYATQVMFHMRGKYWRVWNEQLHPLLVSEQIQTGPLAGSWDPRRPVPDRWAPHAGRLYVTTLNLLSLEVYYRHLPLYESTAK